MPTPIWQEKTKEEAESVNLQADVKADSFLDWLKASKWTAAILLGLAIVIIAAIIHIL